MPFIRICSRVSRKMSVHQRLAASSALRPLLIALFVFAPAAHAAREETIEMPAPLDADQQVAAVPAARDASLASPAAAAAWALSSAHMPTIRSEFALVVDQDTNEVLMQKNPNEVSSIASITKLMTAMVTLDAHLPMDEELKVTNAERTALGWRASALRPGVTLTRAQTLHLALMSSENHAAQLLGRTYPGGIEAAVAAMNAKARELGMKDTSFIEPTGLSPANRATPSDLVRLVEAAYNYPEIREFSAASEYEVPVGKHMVRFRSTNQLTTHPDWQIGLQKTGTLSAAGQCLVMQTVIEGRRVVMVLLDSIGKHSRFNDAQKIHDWLMGRVTPHSRAGL
jgi:D-alanyl-D-alanine endopeptidase (penicillin-binding protein 7)